MNHTSKQAAFVTLLLACLLTTLSGCSSDRSVGPADNIASVTVNADSSLISVGHGARVSLTARDVAGATVAAPTISWVSLTPEVATVSPSGKVNAISIGAAVIEGRVAGLSGRVDLTVIAGLDQASHDFNDGTIGPYNNLAGTDLDFLPDPTGSGRGSVARLHYQAGSGDANRALEFRYPRRWGQPIYFKGEFYLPVGDLASRSVTRKLIYWQSHRDFEKYPVDGGLATGRTVVLLSANDLVVDATYNPAPNSGQSSDDVRTVETISAGLQGDTWYTLEVYQVMESAIGRADGVLQIWLNGQMVFNKATMRWSDPGWVGRATQGVAFEASDIYFERFRVGDQVNWNEGSFDEFRYWDNVQFSTREIGGN